MQLSRVGFVCHKCLQIRSKFLDDQWPILSDVSSIVCLFVCCIAVQCPILVDVPGRCCCLLKLLVRELPIVWYTILYYTILYHYILVPELPRLPALPGLPVPICFQDQITMIQYLRSNIQDQITMIEDHGDIAYSPSATNLPQKDQESISSIETN